MNSPWHQLLAMTTAHIDNQWQLHWQPEEEAGDTAYSPLPQLGVIRAQGKDARHFLQGQLTNDIRDLSPEHSQLSAYCNPKGRMLALFRLVQQGDDILMLLPRTLVDSVLKRLSMFVLRAQVSLSDASDDWLCFGLHGITASTLVAERLGSAPAERDHQVSAEAFCAVCLDGPCPRYLLLASRTAADDLWATLQTQAVPEDTSAWTLRTIQAGEPQVYTQTQETFVPQMLNLQALNGLSFTKGCFVGQEVVARTQHLGKLKRRLYRAAISEGEARPGDELFSPSSTSGQGAGKIVDAAPSPSGGWELLAVMEIDQDKSDMRIGGSEGARLSVLDLPYPVEMA